MSKGGSVMAEEKIGEVGRIAIYDDYAHHPTEIKVLLASMKKGMGKRNNGNEAGGSPPLAW